MTFLTELVGVRFAVEVGTFTGYSALCIARGLPPGGRLLCLDVSEEWTAIGRRHWDPPASTTASSSAWARRPTPCATCPPIHRSTSRSSTPTRAATGRTTTRSWSGCARGGSCCSTTCCGAARWSTSRTTDADTMAIRAVNDHVAADDRVEVVMLPVADGLTIARRRVAWRVRRPQRCAMTITPPPRLHAADAEVVLETLRTTFESGRTRPLAWRKEQLAGLRRMMEEHEESSSRPWLDLGRPASRRTPPTSATRRARSATCASTSGWMKPTQGPPAAARRPGQGAGSGRAARRGAGHRAVELPDPAARRAGRRALAAGNCVVAKPSELAPACSARCSPICSRATSTPTRSPSSRAGWPRPPRCSSSASTTSSSPAPPPSAGSSPRPPPSTSPRSRSSSAASARPSSPPTPTSTSPPAASCGASSSTPARPASRPTTCSSSARSATSWSQRARARDHRVLRRRPEGERELRPHRQRAPLRPARRACSSRRRRPWPPAATPTPRPATSRRRSSSTPTPTSPIMSEEIFGPILPVLAVDVARRRDRLRQRPAEAARAVRVLAEGRGDRRPRPRRAPAAAACASTTTLMHILPADLPFGGVGASGHGRVPRQGRLRRVQPPQVGAAQAHQARPRSCCTRRTRPLVEKVVRLILQVVRHRSPSASSSELG